MLLAWAAMYLKHHYLTDILGGWAYAYLAMKLADFGNLQVSTKDTEIKMSS